MYETIQKHSDLRTNGSEKKWSCLSDLLGNRIKIVPNVMIKL